MIFLEFFIEEPSMEVALKHLVPRILADVDREYEMRIITFNGKTSLLDKLPNRLKAYRHFIQPNQYLFVLVDRDEQDCKDLKQQLETIAFQSGLITRSNNLQNYQVINRIVIEELEAWYFGDVDAIKKAYPRYNPKNPAKYRNPDEITGGTWEALERELAYYHGGGLEKIRAADEIARHMNPQVNQSKSFQVFRDALLAVFG